MNTQGSSQTLSPLVSALARVLDTRESVSFRGSEAESLVGPLRQDILAQITEIRKNSIPALAFSKK